jgi:hypothetical protein
MKKDTEVTLTSIETEAYLTKEILTITLMIGKKYPELSKYIEEMPITIPDEKNPEITRKNLKAYYSSLEAIIAKYILEHQT